MKPSDQDHTVFHSSCKYMYRLDKNWDEGMTSKISSMIKVKNNKPYHKLISVGLSRIQYSCNEEKMTHKIYIQGSYRQV